MRSSRHNQRWPRPRDGPSHRLAITVPCCAHFREGPVLAILAMLALKDALCVAPAGSAPLSPLFRPMASDVPGRDGKAAPQPNQKAGPA